MRIAGRLRGYDRAWLSHDLVAGLIVWGVVTPQAVAYAQIAGLPPSAGLAAAPGALIAYALLGTSRTLVVSATTATSALSAAAVGPLADGDVARFAALSAGLAVVVAVVLVAAGALRLGGVMDLVSKPVMTGFLFGLGLTVALGQLSKLFGVEGTSGKFFEQLWDLLGNLGDTHGWTLAVGAASVAALVAFRRFAPTLPGMLIVLALAIVVSALLDLSEKGVDVVGRPAVGVPRPGDTGHLVGRRGRSPSCGARDADRERRGGERLAGDRARTGLRRRPEQRPGRARRLERPRGPLERVRPVRRREPDARGRAGRRQDADDLDRGRRAHPPHRGVPDRALRGPARRRRSAPS